MSDVKYSLALIVRNCADNLRVLLENYGKHPDEIVVVNTAADPSEPGCEETDQIAREFGASVYHFPWIEDFAAARNFSFEKCSHDYVMWLDSDDIVENPEAADAEIRHHLKDGVKWLIGPYLYEWDGEPGESNCTTQLLRERVVDRRLFEWRAPIHECLCAKYACQGKRMNHENFRVIHRQRRQDRDEQKRKLDRNLKVLETQFPDGNCEPRMNFYWGNTYLGLKEFDKAIEKYRRYLMASDNEPERIVALCSMSEAHRLSGRFNAAERTALDAIACNTQLPTPWMMLAEAQFNNRQFARAVVSAEDVRIRLNHLHEEAVNNPHSLHGRPWFIQAVGFTSMGRFGDAQRCAQEAYTYYPDDVEVKKILKSLSDMRHHHQVKDAFNVIRQELEKEGRDCRALAMSAPKEIQEEQVVNQYLPKPRPRNHPSIAFYCPGGGAEKWSPRSCETGIGGSEEAVINLSRSFAKLGWHVEVYGNVEKKEVDDFTVHWYPIGYWTGEKDNPLDVLIWWRCPTGIIQTPHNAKQNYLWLHDVVPQESWQYECWNEYDKVFVLSQYHREVVKCVPDDKIFFTENGMDPEILVPVDEIQKDPHRIFWGSDPSRGLQFFLPWWKYIRSQVPDAEIDIFYGWSPTYIAKMKQMSAMGINEMQEVYDKIEDLRKQDGVNWHGRVGQKELNEAMAKASCWVYPTKWPEVYCITAIKAQAHGVVPICKHQFSMTDTVKYGIQIPEKVDVGDPKEQKWVADRTIDVLRNEDGAFDIQRPEMIAWARKKTWDAVCEQWISLFEEHPSWKKTPQLAT